MNCSPDYRRGIQIIVQEMQNMADVCAKTELSLHAPLQAGLEDLYDIVTQECRDTPVYVIDHVRTLLREFNAIPQDSPVIEYIEFVRMKVTEKAILTPNWMENLMKSTAEAKRWLSLFNQKQEASVI